MFFTDVKPRKNTTPPTTVKRRMTYFASSTIFPKATSISISTFSKPTWGSSMPTKI